MSEDRVKTIAIVGGGAAAWLCAATLARTLRADFCDVRVIEPPQNTADPNAQTALPSFHRLNGLLGIDENDLIRKTRGTFRLGTEFIDWGCVGERYFHTYGSFGAKLDAVSFHHYLIKRRLAGNPGSIEDYSAATLAAKMHRFSHASLDRHSMLSLYSYGYHFHADYLAAYLREYALAHGVSRAVRNVVEVQLRGADGFIEALRLDDGSRVVADLYIDCGGCGKLFGQPQASGFEDWSHWLPCDRAVGALYTNPGDPAPYSESQALSAGWRARTPLQGCIDSTYTYSSRHLGDDEAAATLQRDLPGVSLGEPRLLRLLPGRPAKFWEKNWIALTGGALDSLEATKIHLVQTGIARLLTLFPVQRFSPCDIDEYNRLTTMEHERIRDYLILHFKSTQRNDSPFWELCRELPIPDTLRAKIELFKHSGRVAMLDDEHFGEDSWLALFFGQNIIPQDYDPLADVLDTEQVTAAFSQMRSMIKEGVAALPTHAEFIQQHCRAAFGAAR